MPKWSACAKQLSYGLFIWHLAARNPIFLEQLCWHCLEIIVINRPAVGRCEARYKDCMRDPFLSANFPASHCQFNVTLENIFLIIMHAYYNRRLQKHLFSHSVHILLDHFSKRLNILRLVTLTKQML